MAPRPSHLLLALTTLGLVPLASIPLVQAQPDTIVPPGSLEAPVSVPPSQGAAPEPLAPASGAGAKGGDSGEAGPSAAGAGIGPGAGTDACQAAGMAARGAPPV
jgi:hypothetical protein